MYMWDLDSYTKQMNELPWEAPLLIDWVREHRVYNHTNSVDPSLHRRYQIHTFAIFFFKLLLPILVLIMTVSALIATLLSITDPFRCVFNSFSIFFSI
jgi:uncharacterized membrane protein